MRWPACARRMVRAAMGPAAPRFLLGAMEGGESFLERRVLRLLEGRLVWGWRGRLVCAAACVAVMAAASVGVGMLAVRASLAQHAVPASEGQRFEVAAIHADDPRNAAKDYMSNNQPRPYPANRVTMRYITLKGLVNEAYGYQYKVVGGPAWIDQIHYDVMAKVPGDAMLSEEQMRPMMRNLLRERFHLKTHFEDKVVPGYDLVVAKGGPKLKPTKGERFLGIVSYFELDFKNDTVKNFATAIAGQVKQPVEDKTGIQGQYDFDLKFMPEQGAPTSGPLADPKYAGLPNIFTAVQEQLGLKLVRQPKVVVRTLVVDSAEKAPMEN